MRLCPGESTEDRLVFRQSAYPIFGIPLIVLGLGIVIGTAREMVRRWPDVLGSTFAILLGAFVTAVGARLLVSRRIVLDRADGSLAETRRVLFWKRRVSRALADFQMVGWDREMKSGSDSDSARYPVFLFGKGEDFEIDRASTASEARYLTRTIGEFLNLQQDHWDAAILDPEDERGRNMRQAQARSVSMLRSFGSLRPAELVVSEFGNRAEIRKTKATGASEFSRRFGMIACSIGVCCLSIAFLGGTFNGRRDAFWEPILAGVVALAVGVIALFGRRDVSFDRDENVVRSSLGVPGLQWSRQDDLHRITHVVYAETLEDTHLMGRVFLQEAGVLDRPVHTSLDLDEARTLARELSAFLKVPLVDGTSRERDETLPS